MRPAHIRRLLFLTWLHSAKLLGLGLPSRFITRDFRSCFCTYSVLDYSRRLRLKTDKRAKRCFKIQSNYIVCIVFSVEMRWEMNKLPWKETVIIFSSHSRWIQYLNIIIYRNIPCRSRFKFKHRISHHYMTLKISLPSAVRDRGSHHIAL